MITALSRKPSWKAAVFLPRGRTQKILEDQEEPSLLTPLSGLSLSCSHVTANGRWPPASGNKVKVRMMCPGGGGSEPAGVLPGQ